MYDVFGLGNALVDTEIEIDDSFLTTHGIAKGHMTLVDSERMQSLVLELTGQNQILASGGSAANSMYAIQAFGRQTTYACRVSADEVGQFFLKDMADAGIDVNENAVAHEGHSGRCLILISHDAERTMNTDLGVSNNLSRDDVDFDKLRASKYFYVEGYLSSSDSGREAAIDAIETCRQASVRAAVSLSDPSMIEFFKEPLTKMLGNGVDLIFCNEEEALAWAGTDRIDIAIAELKDVAPEVYITLGAHGSLAVVNGAQHAAEGVEARAVDTTGAGDMYAGAVLAARCDGADPTDAARFANYCAAHLVTQYGARLKSADAYRVLKASY